MEIILKEYQTQVEDEGDISSHPSYTLHGLLLKLGYNVEEHLTYNLVKLPEENPND